MNIGSMKEELQVSVEMDVLISRISTHQPRRYPRMRFLGSEMDSPVREVLGLEEKIGSSKLGVFVWWSGVVVDSVFEAGKVVESVPSRVTVVAGCQARSSRTWDNSGKD